MLRLAIRNLLNRKMRSLLSIIGTTIAIAGMVSLFSVSEGLTAAVNSTFERIPGLLVMSPGAPAPVVSQLPTAWVSEIRSMEGVRTINPEIWQRVNIIDGEEVTSKPRFLNGTEIASRIKLQNDIYRDDLIEGRYLSEDDVGTFNTVLSKAIAEEFDKTIGDTIEVNGEPLTIVGIYDSGSVFLDIAILISIDSVRAMAGVSAAKVSSYYIEPSEGTDPEVLREDILNQFKGRKLQFEGLGTGALLSMANTVRTWLFDSQSEKTAADKAPLEVSTATQLAGRFNKFSEDFDLFLLLIISIGVSVAVVSIINTMLMSVSERIIEFGILKANGWARSHVLALVTWESALLGTVGGFFGCVLGWLLTFGINNVFPDRVQLFASPSLLAWSLLFSAVMGIIGGLYPAIWAMRLMPMDAIRRG